MKQYLLGIVSQKSIDYWSTVSATSIVLKDI